MVKGFIEQNRVNEFIVIAYGKILNHHTNKIVIVNAKPTDKMRGILQKLFPTH